MADTATYAGALKIRYPTRMDDDKARAQVKRRTTKQRAADAYANRRKTPTRRKLYEDGSVYDPEAVERRRNRYRRLTGRPQSRRV